MAIAPGKTVTVKIVSPPTNEAARKTLIRICRKDPLIAKHDRRQHDKRPSFQTWRRGGRPWEHRMKTVSNVKLVAGQTYSVFGTVDVLRDLESVKRFVKLSAK